MHSSTHDDDDNRNKGQKENDVQFIPYTLSEHEGATKDNNIVHFQ